MIKRVVLTFSLVMLLTACLTFGTSHVAFAQSITHASAHRADCGVSALSGTTMDAKGSTSANVSATVWYDSCTGLYYASANSFLDSNGFAFHGTIYLVNSTSGVVSYSTCNFSGICNTPEISIAPTASYYIEYDNNNGVFYTFTNERYSGASYITGWAYII